MFLSKKKREAKRKAIFSFAYKIAREGGMNPKDAKIFALKKVKQDLGNYNFKKSDFR